MSSDEYEELINNSTSRNTQYVTFADKSIGLIFCLLMVINIVFGTLANFCFLNTMFTDRKLRVQKYYGILSLASIDFLVCAIASPLQLTREIISLNENKNLSPIFCSFITFVSTWTSLSSIFSLMIISAERYLLFRNNKQVDKCKFLAFTFILHVVSFVVSMISAVLNAIIKTIIHTRCTTQNIIDVADFEPKYPRTDSVFVLFSIFKGLFLTCGLISFIVIFYSYFKIYKIIKMKRVVRLKLNIVSISQYQTNKFSSNTTTPNNGSLIINQTLKEEVYQFDEPKNLETIEKQSPNRELYTFNYTKPSRRWSVDQISIIKGFEKLEKQIYNLNNCTKNHSDHSFKKGTNGTSECKQTSIANTQYKSAPAVQNYMSTTTAATTATTIIKKPDSLNYSSHNNSSGNKRKPSKTRFLFKSNRTNEKIANTSNITNSTENSQILETEFNTKKEKCNLESSISSTQNYYNQSMKKQNLCTKSIETIALKKTFVIILVFMIFWLPYLLIQLIILINNKESFLLEHLNLITIAIGFCHSTLNPFVYCYTNNELLSAMKDKYARFIPNCLLDCSILRKTPVKPLT